MGPEQRKYTPIFRIPPNKDVIMEEMQPRLFRVPPKAKFDPNRATPTQTQKLQLSRVPQNEDSGSGTQKLDPDQGGITTLFLVPRRKVDV